MGKPAGTVICAIGKFRSCLRIRDSIQKVLRSGVKKVLFWEANQRRLSFDAKASLTLYDTSKTS